MGKNVKNIILLNEIKKGGKCKKYKKSIKNLEKF